MDTQKATFAHDEHPAAPSAVSSYEWKDFEWQLLAVLLKAGIEPVSFAGHKVTISLTRD
ncbi:hypothetical protein [Stutzerimonas stutzeri]|jgi:hypothetical protein|uniref:hypothetical protein n=1 Tax=Stutzerimonas stutzeri TaxID=316 RepID=UPI00187C725B|nr:hypothetical protein [Stutzerimonas stutzeri]